MNQTPKCLAFHVTSCPSSMSPVVQPAMARSSVGPVETQCRSIDLERSKQRSIGAFTTSAMRMTGISAPLRRRLAARSKRSARQRCCRTLHLIGAIW